MGTNYYFFTKNRELARNHFADNRGDYVIGEEYEIVDEPDLGYLIHLNKLSYGWKPLFQKHKAFQTFAELEKFYHKHAGDLQVFDEYNRELSWDEYKEHVMDHSDVEPRPVKWVCKDNPNAPSGKRLETARCEADEADIFTPFDHVEYFETEQKASEKYGVSNYFYGFEPPKYARDPEYPVDWTEGEFS